MKEEILAEIMSKLDELKTMVEGLGGESESSEPEDMVEEGTAEGEKTKYSGWKETEEMPKPKKMNLMIALLGKKKK